MADDPRGATPDASKPGALLCNANFYGTLAAARSLGRAGVPVVVADADRVAPALFSRHVARRRRCPSTTDAAGLLEWLLRFGEREGRHVLYPTSDELVYLFSAHRDELGRYFALYQPDVDTTLRVLDKKKLLQAARAAGVEAPETWFPSSPSEVPRIVREARGPLMVKPRTQLFLTTHQKGAVAASSPDAVRAQYETFVRRNSYGPPVKDSMPELAQPMLQRYYPDAALGIYSLTGFRDRSGGSLALLGAVKRLQRPRTLGIGLCFEAAAVEPELAARVSRLLEALGYHGVFELEFVRSEGRSLLIDMNPRFYNQIALDIARGLDLPRLAYAAALGQNEEVARLSSAVRPDGEAYAYCNRFGLRVLVAAQRLFGTMSPGEAAHWRKWAAEPGRVVVDAVADDGDPGPFVAEVVSQVYGYLRHPRAFIRMIALDR